MRGGPALRAGVREVFAAAAPGYGRGNPLLAVERAEMGALLPEPRGLEVLDLGADSIKVGYTDPQFQDESRTLPMSSSY